MVVKRPMDTTAAGRSPRPPWRLWARWSIATCSGCLAEIGSDVFWLCQAPVTAGGDAEFTMTSTLNLVDLVMHVENAFV